MLVPFDKNGEPAFIPKALFTIYGRSSDSLLQVCRLPETLYFSGILADFKSLQQRELSRISTGFPIEPLRHQISLQKYEILLIYFKNRKNQSANFFRKFKGLIFSVFKNNQRKSGLGTVYFQTDVLWLFLF